MIHEMDSIFDVMREFVLDILKSPKFEKWKLYKGNEFLDVLSCSLEDLMDLINVEKYVLDPHNFVSN